MVHINEAGRRGSTMVAVFWMIFTLSQVAPSTAQTCGEGLSTLEVAYSDQVRVLPYLGVDIEQVALDNHIVGDSLLSDFYLDEESEIPPKVTVCIQESQCTRVNIEGRSNDVFERESSITIRQDGNEIPLGKFYPETTYAEYTDAFVTTTFLGNCTPTCGVDETLLELEVFIGGAFGWSGFHWIIQDSSTNKVYAQCNQYDRQGGELPRSDCTWLNNQFYNPKICLPTNGCYQLAIGAEKDTSGVKAEWFGTFGGTQIFNLQDVHFTSIDLDRIVRPVVKVRTGFKRSCFVR